ncbi:MAG: NusA-like transcription termination signal-binding factor [Candidatus Micrarchaeota archaeon]
MVELTGEDLTFFSKFESITGVMPKDYVASENVLTFLVDGNKLGKAIGKKGANIQKLGKIFRKKVVITGDSDDLEQFVRGFFSNIGIQNIEVRDIMGEKAVMMIIDEKDRGIAIGRGGERIKAAKSFLGKKFKATIHLRTRRTAI